MLLALMRKEVLALLRDVHGLAALFLMPVLFIVVMSLALKDVYSPQQQTLAYAVDAQDQGAASGAFLQQWLRSHGGPQPLPAEWRTPLRAGTLKYVLVLLPGLSDELGQPTFPTQPRIRLLVEPGMDGNVYNTLQAEVVGAAGELKARNMLAQTDAKSSADASMRALLQAERFAAGARPTAVQQNVPAWLVFGMFFVIASLSSLLVQERSTGTLARLHSLGVPRGVLLASKALPYLAVNAVQAVLMLAVGVWLMPRIGGDALSLAGISWPALLVMLLATSLAAVGMALALASAVRTHAQAAAIGPIVNVLMAAVGGIMVPKFVMPAFMQRVAEWSPMNWGLEGLLTVLLRGGVLRDALPQALRLGAFAAIAFLIAMLLSRRPQR